jgi:hypothetical protein
MTPLLTTISLWLAAQFGLPATAEHPRVAFVPAERMVSIRHEDGEATGLAGQTAPLITSDEHAADTLAIYHQTTQTIYLRQGWTGATPAELSILVHEMVHHLQAVGDVRHDCPAEREKLAFQAQNRWLELFGTDLAREFRLDPFSLLVKTSCGF